MEELTPRYYFENVDIFPLKNFFGVENVWEALKKKDEFLTNMKNEIGGNVDGNSLVKGDIVIGAGTVVEFGTVIKGPVYIGKNCKIGPQACIRPGTIICDNAEIGRAEVKNSIIFPGVKAHHVCYIGDSIIGSNVNIAVGVQTLNVRNDNKDVMVYVKNEKYSTGTRKFGAVVGDNCKLAGNSVLNPGTLIGKNCWTYPSIVLKGFYPSNKVIKSSTELVEMVK